MSLQYDTEFLAAAGPLLSQLSQYPRPAAHDVSSRRAALEAFVAQNGQQHALPDGIEKLVHEVQTGDKDTLTIYHYRKEQTPANAPAIIHLHGGGYISLSAAQHETAVTNLVMASGVQMLSVEYRLAPEHPYPAALDDAWAALTWLHAHADELSIDRSRIAVYGESAGGGLAASLAILARDRGLSPPLAKQILVYPMIDDRTVVNHAGKLAFWDADDNITGWTAYLGKSVPGTERVSPYAAAARVESVEGLPPLYLDVPQLDMFVHEDAEYARRFLDANIPTELHVYPGLPHGKGYACGLLPSSSIVPTSPHPSVTMTTVARPSGEALTSTVGNKVAIVTGAARGIGYATATLLAQHGSRVVLVDLREDALQKACETIGPQATYKTCDVSDWDQQVALFDWVVKNIGPIDLVVCNAAINPEISLLATNDAEERKKMNDQVRYNYLADERIDGESSSLKRPSTQVLDININSVIFGLKLGIHHMKPTGGRVVVVASAAAYMPVPSQSLYTASKHAVLGLARSTAMMEEVAQSGIAISWVAPWLTLTSMVEGIAATTQENTLKSSPTDVAWAIVAAAAASKENANGKGFWVQGSTITEVEGAYWEVAGRLILPENRF
ncbi:Alpha/Beta hydrolase protein [Aspergillus floccosus]